MKNFTYIAPHEKGTHKKKSKQRCKKLFEFNTKINSYSNKDNAEV